MDRHEISAYVRPFYEESHRHYHAVDHYELMFDALEWNIKKFNLTEDEHQALLYAIGFHDIVYNIPTAGNEVYSAAHFVQFARERGVSYPVIQMANQMILASERHFDGSVYDDVTSLFLDLDLYTLGGEDRVAFELVQEAIDEEFLTVYSPEEVRKNRAIFIHNHLSKAQYRILTERNSQLAKNLQLAKELYPLD